MDAFYRIEKEEKEYAIYDGCLDKVSGYYNASEVIVSNFNDKKDLLQLTQKIESFAIVQQIKIWQNGDFQITYKFEYEQADNSAIYHYFTTEFSKERNLYGFSDERSELGNVLIFRNKKECLNYLNERFELNK